MKQDRNIHILPTDKPSKLHNYTFDGLWLSKKVLNWKEARNICITNDEDIKENDYIITKDGRLVQVSYLLSKDLDGASKVILTTDQDLIKDGVQAIDDEFLEWFVKNPSCEEVFLTNDFEQVNQDNPILRGSTNVVHKYKIIIPKEEPKQETTLEEAAEKYYEDNIDESNIPREHYEWEIQDLMIGFANQWQQERDKKMYSKEEMLNFAWFLIKNVGQYSDDRMAHFEGKYLEKFKTK